MLGLKPWEFWRMTPHEFLLFVQGYTWRDDQAWQKTAWQTAHIMNVWLDQEDRVTIDDILPKREAQEKEPMTDEQMAENALAWAISMGAEDRRR